MAWMESQSFAYLNENYACHLIHLIFQDLRFSLEAQWPNFVLILFKSDFFRYVS